MISRNDLYVTANVTEQKAPTDDSIRLYGEMLDKARKEVVEAFRLNNNVVDFNIVHTVDYLHGQDKYQYRIKLNGKTLDGVCIIDNVLTQQTTDEVIQTIINKIGRDIALFILSSSFKRTDFV